MHTAGNEDCHIILRGGKAPNYDAASVEATCGELARAGLAARLMIDCSHANSQKQHERQVDVGARRRGADRGRRRAHLRRDARKPSQSGPPGPRARASSCSTACRSPTPASAGIPRSTCSAHSLASVRERRAARSPRAPDRKRSEGLSPMTAEIELKLALDPRGRFPRRGAHASSRAWPRCARAGSARPISSAPTTTRPTSRWKGRGSRCDFGATERAGCKR